MKTLTIVRHAKSSWNTNHEDHDRPLNTRGLDAAPKVGAEILRVILSHSPKVCEREICTMNCNFYDNL